MVCRCPHSRRDIVATARDKEMAALSAYRYISALNSFVGGLSSVAIPIAVYGWYVKQGNDLDAKTAFTVLAWIANLQWSVQTIPYIYGVYALISPSLCRMTDFFALGGDFDCSSSDSGGGGGGGGGSGGGGGGGGMTDFGRDVVLMLDDAVLGYPGVGAVASDSSQENEAPEEDVRVRNEEVEEGNTEDSQPPQEKVVLQSISLELKSGSTTIIAGPVGSGKSTLLQSMALALPHLGGQVSLAPDIQRGFVSQDPFLLNATIRENILFGRPLDQQRYDHVIHKSALEVDVRSLRPMKLGGGSLKSHASQL